MNFIDLLREIGLSKVRYLLVGGVAVNLHGIVRPTKDIDFIVYLEKKNLLEFIKIMTRLGYRPKVPVAAEDFADPEKRKDWIKNKNMIVFSFYHNKDLMNVVDVFVKHPLPFEGLFKRRELIDIGGVNISVIGIRDLIKLKEKANRLQDLHDIRSLKQVLEIRKKK